ncbi:MAG: hypothetical protein NT030_07600, partial [Candidatus Saganbacteria bacterium]|nr:hypothetical protein [Candidatus Saganbacteria bacterium]
IYSVLFYFPICALFLSRGYSPEIAMFFTAFWVAQMIYGPTGIRFMDLMEIGEQNEPLRYDDLDSDPRLIPKTKLIRLSNRGLGREGKVPIFLVRDIINAIFTGYRVKILLDNDPRNLFYPATAGAVANAKVLEARVYAINRMFISQVPEIDKLDKVSKIILLRLFLKENLWDPTHEFDHAINSAYSGSWPSEKSNKLFNKHGNEAGDVTCGKALKRLMEDAAKAKGSNAKIFKKIASIIEDYSSKETRISLYNIFDDEYMKKACAVLAARIGLYPKEKEKDPKKKAEFDAVVSDIFKAFEAGREEALIEEYYKLAQEVKIPKDRAWQIAAKLIGDIQKEIKITELTSIMDKIVARVGVEYGEKEKLIDGMSGILEISRGATEEFVTLVMGNDIAKLAAYLAERPITPDNFHAALRDLSTLLLFFERPDAEDSNIVPFYHYIAKNISSLSPDIDNPLPLGQQKILNLIFDTVICNNLEKWIEDLVADPEMRKKIVDKYIKTGDLNVALSEINTQGVQNEVIRILNNNAPKAVHEWITSKLEAGNTGMTIARNAQAQFKMKKMLFNANDFSERLYFLINGLAKGIAPTFSRLLPERKYEYLAKWLSGLGTEIAIALAEKQMFSFDYFEQIDEEISRGGISRDTAEDIVFDKWLKGIKQPVYDTVDRMLKDLKRKFTRKLTAPEIEMIKFEILTIVEKELGDNKNEVNNNTTGLEWVMAHEMPGIKHLSEEAKKDQKVSRLAAFIARYFPKSKAPSSWESISGPFKSKLELKSPLTFLDSLPGTLEELREINNELIKELKDHINKHSEKLEEKLNGRINKPNSIRDTDLRKKIQNYIEELKNTKKEETSAIDEIKRKMNELNLEIEINEIIQQDIKALIDLGVGDFNRNKGYLNILWDLTWELPELILGRKGKYLSLYEKGRLLRIEKGEADNFKKYAYLDDKLGNAEKLIRELVAVRGKAMSIKKGFRYQLLAAKNPELLYGTAIEGYTATFISKDIVDAFMEGKIEQVKDLGNYMEKDIASKFFGAYMSDANAGVWVADGKDMSPGNILKPIFKRAITQADILIKSGDMKILKEEDLK